MNSTNISSTAKLSKPISAIQKIQSLSNQGVLTQLQLSSNGQIPPSSNAIAISIGNGDTDVPKKRSRWDTTGGVEAIGKSNISTIAPATASVTVTAARTASASSTALLSLSATSGGVKKNLSSTSLGGGAMTISLPSLPMSRGAGGASAGRFIG